MRIVVGAIDFLAGFLVPACPAAPIEIAAIEIGGKFVGLVVEQTLPCTVFFWSIVILQVTPENAIDKLLIFFELFFVRLAEFLHGSGEPRARAAFISQA